MLEIVFIETLGCFLITLSRLFDVGERDFGTMYFGKRMLSKSKREMDRYLDKKVSYVRLSWDRPLNANEDLISLLLLGHHFVRKLNHLIKLSSKNLSEFWSPNDMVADYHWDSNPLWLYQCDQKKIAKCL